MRHALDLGDNWPQGARLFLSIACWQHEAGMLTGKHVCEAKQAGSIDISTVSLDDPSLVPPSRHIFCACQVPWLKLADGVPCQDGDYQP